jgi:hypothetical protein
MNNVVTQSSPRHTIAAVGVRRASNDSRPSYTRVPDYRLSPPEDPCRICREPVRTWGTYDTCGNPDCVHLARVKDAQFDARDLANTALARDESDPLQGLAWLWYQWRTQPTDDEAFVRNLALTMVCAECTAAELAVWHELRNDRTVTTLAAAMDAKHAYARAVRDQLASVA